MNAYNLCVRNCGEHLAYISEADAKNGVGGARYLLGIKTVKGGRRKWGRAEEEGLTVLHAAELATPPHSRLPGKVQAAPGRACPGRRGPVPLRPACLLRACPVAGRSAPP